MSTEAPGPQLHERRHWRQLIVAGVIGALIAAFVPLPAGTAWVDSALLGFTAAALIFGLPLLVRIMRADADETARLVNGLDPGRSVTDVVVLVGALFSVIGLGVLVVHDSSTLSSTAVAVEAGIGLLSVAAAWLVVHLTFALRYARYWYNGGEGSIDFHWADSDPDPRPRFSDFAYLAYTIGMSFAVSDTDLRHSAMRHMALQQAWLSYLFGTVIIGAMINLISGLAG